jgi:hypothetical protein
MSQDHIDKIAELMSKLDRICADAQQIREEIGEIAKPSMVWPERRHHFRPLSDTAESSPLATPPSPERSN